MFSRTVLFCLFLFSIGFVVACNQEETKTAVQAPIPTATPINLALATPVDTKAALPPSANEPTQTSVAPTTKPSPSPTPMSVYNPDTIFSTSLSMSEQCMATNNTYYLRYREDVVRSGVFLSPDNNYKLEYIGDTIWLGPREGPLTQLPFTVTDIRLTSNGVHWSPDSSHIVLGSSYGGMSLWLALADGSDLTLLSPAEYYNSFVAWSSDGQYLAWIDYKQGPNGDRHYQMVIQSPEEKTSPLFKVDDLSVDHLTGIGWSADDLYFAWIAEMEDTTKELRIWSSHENRQIYQTEVYSLQYANWSPQGYWLQGRHINNLAYEHILLHADGSNFFRFPTTSRIYSPPIWSPNGQAFVVRDENDQTKILIINTDGQVFKDIFIDKYIPWRDQEKIWSMAHWLQDEHSFFYIKHQGEDETFLPMLYDSETGVTRPLFPDGVSLEAPVITADNSQLFLVHTIGSDAWIKTIATDGSSERILVDDAYLAEQLTLFDDDRYLAYAIWHNQGWQVELVDIETGQQQLLQDNLLQVRGIAVNEERDAIIVSSIEQDGTERTSIFSNDGHLLYQANNATSYQPISPEFWSPNGETAVIKLNVNGRNNNESLVLAYPDDREWVIVRSGLSGLGDPYWSPDSQMFAFTQLIVPLVSKGIDLEIVDLEGNTLWSYSPFPLDIRYSFGEVNTLEWVACP